MSLFDSLGGQAPVDPMQLLQQIQQNPASVLRRGGLTIPDGMNDPQQIVNHLLQSGQISNKKLQLAMQMMVKR